MSAFFNLFSIISGVISWLIPLAAMRTRMCYYYAEHFGGELPW